MYLIIAYSTIMSVPLRLYGMKWKDWEIMIRKDVEGSSQGLISGTVY